MAKSQRSQNLTHGLRTYLARQDQGPTAWICARLTDQKHDRTVYGLDLTICATFLQNDLIMHRGSLLCRLSPAFIFATTEHMISNLDTAKKVYGTLLSTIEGLNRGFEDASDKLSESERHSYGRAIGKIVDAITSEALTPLLEAHAHLGTPELFGMRTLQDTDELPDCLTGSLPGLAGHYELAPGEHTELCAPYIGFEVTIEVIPAMETISLMVTKPSHHGVSCVVIEGTTVHLEPTKAMNFIPHASFCLCLGIGSEVRVRNESNLPIKFNCMETRLMTSSDGGKLK